MLTYYTDLDEEIGFAIYDEDNKTKKIIKLLITIFDKQFEEAKSDMYEEYGFHKTTLLISPNNFCEELLELSDFGIDILIVP